MEQFDNDQILHFELKETLCFGVEQRWNKYNVPVQLDMDTKNQLSQVSKLNSATSPIHGERTIYLKIEGLTIKQRIDLLDRGKCYVHVKFDCVGVYTNNKTKQRHLVLKLKKLAKCDKEVELETAED